MIMYFYYKNIVFAIPQCFYLFYNAYSGQTLFEDFYISFFNLLFTSWPVIIRAIFDQDIYYKKWSRQSASQRPNQNKKYLKSRDGLKQNYNLLYYVGQQNLLFNMKNISLWFLNSIAAALFIFFMCKFSYSNDKINSSGQVQDIWYFSILIYTVVIFVVDLKLMMFTKHFNAFTFIAVILCSIILYIIYFFIADLIPIFLIYKTANAVISSSTFFLTLLLILGVLFIIDLMIISLDREFNTPLFMLFKSLIQKKYNQTDEEVQFIKIAKKMSAT